MGCRLPQTPSLSHTRDIVETLAGSANPLLPCVLVIAGIDPGGGAGLAADIRAVTKGGAFACPVAATVTIQSTSGLVSQHPLSARLVSMQASEVLAHQTVRAIKTGALGDEDVVRAVARLARAHRGLPLVVDPVRLPTRASRAAGSRESASASRPKRSSLIDANGFVALRDLLVPLATVLTANADEASALTGVRVHDRESASRAARVLVSMGARAALVKGGHAIARNAREVIDVLAIEEDLVMLAAPRLPRLRTLHGGGCMLASLIAARLAVVMHGRGDAPSLSTAELVASVRWSRVRHHRWLARSVVDVGGLSTVLDP